MPIFKRAHDLHAFLAPLRMHGKRIALVPTMGNLHTGHYSLVTLARSHADVVVATVFVNPTQFGPNEDFARYPRTPETDAKGLSASGCDALFMPAVEEMYPYGPAQIVREGPWEQGARRPVAAHAVYHRKPRGGEGTKSGNPRSRQPFPLSAFQNP